VHSPLGKSGAGQVAVSHVELTDGVVRLHPAGWPASRRRILGRPACSAKANQPVDPQEAQVATQARAPRQGFPAVDFEKNTAGRDREFYPLRVGVFTAVDSRRSAKKAARIAPGRENAGTLDAQLRTCTSGPRRQSGRSSRRSPCPRSSP
jgi:hypothetical protein